MSQNLTREKTEYSTSRPKISGSKLANLFILFSRSEFEHPLVVGNVKRKARTLGVEVKTVNDWEQFLGDEQVKGMLFSAGERYRKSGFFQMSDELRAEDERQIR